MRNDNGRALALLSFAIFALALVNGVRVTAQGEPKPLDRAEDPVVLTAAEVPKLKGVPRDLVRAFACRGGKLVPILFQVDARTPELNYYWTAGPDPVPGRTPDSKIEDDDEIVFMAKDSGERAPASLSPEPSPTSRSEVELKDPETGGKGWVYLFSFADSDRRALPSASGAYVKASPDKGGGTTFRGETFQVASEGTPGATGRPTHVRFLGKDGVPGKEAVLDAARARVHARYLFVRIDRDGAEARTSLGSSYIDGPVRIVAPVAIEAYLIWGSWISATRSVLYVYGNAWEQRSRLSVPVSLDESGTSEARIGVELASAEGWRLRNDRNPAGVALGGGTPADLGFPSWNLLHGPEGALLSRLELDPRLRNARNGLYVEGSQAGFRVDLTGLRKSEESAPYELAYIVYFLKEYRQGDEARLVRVRDAPLVRTVR